MISSPAIWCRPSMAERLSIEQQADYVDDLARRCIMRGGEPATEATLVLTKDDVEILDALAHRLRRMAPHEEAIKRVVVGK